MFLACSEMWKIILGESQHFVQASRQDRAEREGRDRTWGLTGTEWAETQTRTEGVLVAALSLSLSLPSNFTTSALVNKEGKVRSWKETSCGWPEGIRPGFPLLVPLLLSQGTKQ